MNEPGVATTVDRDIQTGCLIITATRNQRRERATVVLERWQEGCDMDAIRVWLANIVAKSPEVFFKSGLRVSLFTVGDKE